MSINSEILRKNWLRKEAFVPGASGGAPGGMPPGGGGMPPMPPGGDPMAGGMAPAMDPMMAGGGGGMPVDPSMMGAPPPMPPGGDPAMMDPAAMGIPPGPEAAMGIPPGPDAGAGGGETMLPMSEVVELLGAVTGKRAPKVEDPKDVASGDAALAAGAGDGAAPPPADAGAPMTNPVTPLGGLDPSMLG